MKETFPNLLWHDGMALRGQGSKFYTTCHHLIETSEYGRSGEELCQQKQSELKVLVEELKLLL